MSLPQGWVMTTVGAVTERVATVDPRSAPDAEFTYIDIGSIDRQRHRVAMSTRLFGREAPSRARQLLRAGDTVLSTVRVNLRNVAYITHEFDGGVGSTGFCVLRAGPQVDPMYLHYYVLTEEFTRPLIAEMRGTSYPAIVADQVRARPLPLAPPTEQHEIAVMLDGLFAGLEAARVALQSVQRSLERFHLSLLRAAVAGALIQSCSGAWRSIALGDLGELDRGRSRHRPRNDSRLYGGPYPFIQTAEVAAADPWIRGYTATYNESGLAQSRLWPRGTLCITIAANIAKTGILTFDACFPDSVVGFRAFDGDVATRWIELVIRSMQGQLDRAAPATAQKNINLAMLRRLAIPYPAQSLQDRILSEYDHRVSALVKLRQHVVKQQVRCDMLRRVILSAAFSGALRRRRAKAAQPETANSTAPYDLVSDTAAL